MAAEDQIERYISNDPAAQNAFVKRYYPLIFSIVVRKIGKPDQAEDLVQDIFLRIFKSDALAKFRGETEKELVGYIGRIAHYTVSDNYKRFVQKEDLVISSNLSEDDYVRFLATESDVFEQVVEADVKAKVEQAVATLRPDYRRVIKLRLMNYTNKEISEMINKPKATVDTWMLRALKELKDKLKNLNVK